MEIIKLTDAEVNFVALAMQKVDPTQIMQEPQAILAKIRQYAQERAQEQATTAAEVGTEAE